MWDAWSVLSCWDSPRMCNTQEGSNCQARLKNHLDVISTLSWSFVTHPFTHTACNLLISLSAGKPLSAVAEQAAAAAAKAETSRRGVRQGTS